MSEKNCPLTRVRQRRVASLVVLLSVISNNTPADELQVGRYQSIRLVPTEVQQDLLSSIVDTELAPEITTIGGAIAELLEGSGYRLLSAKLAEPYRVILFSMPLPEVQRRLGPVSLHQALELLSGPAFRLVIDPVYRLVSFDLLEASTSSDSNDGTDE